MLMFNMLQWWYSEGWGIFTRGVFEKLSGLADFFSFGTIFRTFFAPFRQIDSATFSDTASLSERFSSLISSFVSRLVGACVRFVIAIVGFLAIIFSAVLSFLVIGLWPLVPLFPVAGVILSISGVVL